MKDHFCQRSWADHPGPAQEFQVQNRTGEQVQSFAEWEIDLLLGTTHQLIVQSETCFALKTLLLSLSPKSNIRDQTTRRPTGDRSFLGSTNPFVVSLVERSTATMVGRFGS